MDTLKENRPGVIWLTGLSGAGKTTLAEALMARLGDKAFLLDGDSLRQGLNRDLGFSPEDRLEVGRRIGEVARLLMEAGFTVIVASISPYRQVRDGVRALFDAGEFMEVYVRCPLEVCERRDPKGLYRKVRNGEIGSFTGIHQPYEEPLAPEVTVRTDLEDVETCAGMILECWMAER